MNLITYLIYFFITYSYTPGTVNQNYYVLGPGDRILIVSESTGEAIKTIVSPDGNVPIYSPWTQDYESDNQNTANYQQPKAFLVSAIVEGKGLTIRQFADTLSYFTMKLFGKKDSFRVMLISPRMVSLEISGAVYHPGIYTLPANYTIADALWSAGGLTGTACYTRIALISGKDTVKVNLGTFDRLNDPSNNRNISSFQKIFVPFTNTDSSVYIVGDISTHPLASPVFMSLGTGTDSLISSFSIRSMVISRSLSRQAPLDSILCNLVGTNMEAKVSGNKVFVKRDGKIKSVNSMSFTIKPGDSIFIFPLFRGVLVSGEVMRPGTLIPFVEGASVDYYISKAGGKSQFAGPVKILRGFKLIGISKKTIPEDGDVIIVNYSRTKRFAEYVSILQGLITLLTLYLAYSK